MPVLLSKKLIDLIGVMHQHLFSPISKQSGPQIGILHLLLFFRLIMLGFFAWLQSGYFIGEKFDLEFEFRIFCLAVIMISFFQLIFLRRAKSTVLIGALQLSVDILLLTYVLGVTNNSSSFSFYLVLIVCASLVTNALSAVSLAALSGLCYAALMNGLFLHNSEISKGVSTFEILISYMALVVAALVAAMYAKGLERINTSIAEQNKELEKATAQQMQLMNSLAEGVITIDVNSAITGVNEAAKTILGLASYSSNHLIGKDLRSTFQSAGVSDLKPLSLLDQEGSCELRYGTGGEESVLRCSALEIGDEGSGDNGRVIFLSDVSEFKSMESRLEFHERMTRLLVDFDQYATSSSDLSFELVGVSTPVEEVRTLVRKLGPSDAPALILGESGTGKELVARSLHSCSARSNMPFIPVNCGAIPESLIESELFGHKRGSFTGADRDTLGLFREAEGGTLFLDEIGELPLHLQAKLLRALQDKVVRPVGASKEIPVDVRIIAATNRNLKEDVKNGLFREDLYYRLRVVEISVPPLRARRDDIPLLIVHFLEKEGYSKGEAARVSPEALNLLVQYDYPGNIRELENIVARACVLGGGGLLPETLPEEVRFFKPSAQSCTEPQRGNVDFSSNELLPIDLEALLENLERKYLLIALSRADGVKKDAARLLGLNFRSFRYRLKKYGIDDTDEHQQPGPLEN